MKTLQYKGFVGLSSFSKQDNGYFGKIVGIPDLVNFESKDKDGLYDAFIEAVEDYIKTIKKIK